MSRFTKIAADGSTLPADATGHVAVLDTTNDLMWSATELTDEEVTQHDADTLAKGLALAGHADWRLPTVEELFALADRTRYRPAIDTDAFPGCKSDWYWTSTPWASSSDYAWLVNFHYGLADDGLRGYHNGFVRAVRVASSPGQ